MSIFNDAQLEGMFGGVYICSQCGGKMEFENEWRDVLVCPCCGHSVELDRYGCEDEESYHKMYPTREEVLGEDK